MAGTPCYLVAEQAIEASIEELGVIRTGLPHRHWLSVKTQPVQPLLEAWRRRGFGVEVVSEYELAAALRLGFTGEAILVNGVAKHAWLSRHQIPNLNVHFDSLAEIDALKDQARALNWSLGLRCQVPNQRDLDEPEFQDQFGLTSTEAVRALMTLGDAGLKLRGLHFHIGTNVQTADQFQIALNHLHAVCQDAEFTPEYVDIGGGLPVTGEKPVGADRATPPIDLEQLGEVLATVPRLFPTVRELWLENGRFVSARAGVLVVKVVDRKERPECSYLICDGGRTNHALVSGWEVHDILLEPEHDGPTRLTTVCGPTCMASDRLGRWQLPTTVAPGDLIIWMNAGAYHIPWETRFSVGLAPVVWCDLTRRLVLARKRESPEEWSASWTNSKPLGSP